VTLGENQLENSNFQLDLHNTFILNLYKPTVQFLS